MEGRIPGSCRESGKWRLVLLARLIIFDVLAIVVSCSRSPSKPSQRLWSVSFSPDSTAVVAGGGEGQSTPPHPGELVFWQIGKGRTRIVAETASIRSVAWSPNGKFVAVGDFAGVTKMVSAETGETLLPFSPPANQVNAAAVSPDANLVAGATFDGTIDLWNTAGKEQHLFLVQGEKLLDVAISPDGVTMAATSQSGYVYLFDMISRGEPAKIQAYPGPKKSNRSAECVAFAHDGLSFATGSLKTLRIWETRTGVVKQEVACTANVNNVAFAPDDEAVATVHADGTLALWNCHTGERLNSTQAHPDDAFGLSFAPNGNLIATASRNDFTIKIWNATTLQLVSSLGRSNPK